MTTSKKGFRASTIWYSPFGITKSFQHGPSPGNASRGYRSDTQLAPDDRRHLSAEDFYGVQHFFVWQRGDTHLECDARNATENFIHVKDLVRDRFSVAD